MNTFFKSCLISLGMLVCFNAIGQVQFSTGASLLKGSGYYDNHSYLLGGGVSMKYVYKDRYLIGFTGRMYQANTTAYEHYNSSDKEQNLTGTVEIIFNRTKIMKPYLGFDVGVSQASRMINYVRNYGNHVVFAPKGGFYYSLGQSTGLFGQLQYNYCSGDGGPSRTTDVFNSVLTEPIQKYFTLDFGIFVRLYVKVK